MKKYNLNNKPWEIICDFDGTISLIDVTDSLLEKFATPEWKSIEKNWQDGVIGSRECLARQIPLLEMSQVELNRHLDEIEIDTDFLGFVAEVQQKDHQVVVVSDGLDYAIEYILNRYGLGYLEIKANQLVQHGERAWNIAFPHTYLSCEISSGNCKCAVAQQYQQDNTKFENFLLIGDGTSDFCVAGKVDFVFAKNALIQHCVRQQIPHYPMKNFSQARSLFSQKHPAFASRM